MSPRRLRARDSLLSCLLISASLALTAFPADAQSVSGRARSPWMIWSDSRSDDWNEARERVRAEEARPLMEALSRRSRDAEGSARAAYWLGLYHYGSGDPATAAPYFDLAAGGEDPEVARQARIWNAQCRQLLGGESEGATDSPPENLRDSFALRAAVSEADALVRAGHPLEALRSYLALEAEARALECLSWIYYRVGLILSASGTREGSSDWAPLAEWDPVVATSPERALIAKLRNQPRAVSAPRESAPFAEPVVAEAQPSVSAEPGEFPDSLFERPESMDEAPEPRQPSNAPSGYYALQLGAFRERDSARRAMEEFTARGLSVRLEQKTDAQGDLLHLIWLGRCATREEAESLARRLLQGIDYQIVTGNP
jgi:cell division septation protein DedD